MLNCTFPSCRARLEPNQGRVPAIEAIRNVTGKLVTVKDLAKFVLCGRHSHVARKEGVQTYSYAGTAALIERRVAERETVRAHFLHLRTKTQMGKAIAKALTSSTKSAGSASQTGQGAPKPPAAEFNSATPITVIGLPPKLVIRN